MHPLARLLQVMGNAAMAAVVVALIMALLRRWSLSLRISRVVAWCGLGIPVLIVSMYLFSPRSVAGVEVDPSQQARVLAETLSEVLSCGAFAFTAALPSLPLAVFARWRLRIARGEAEALPERPASLPEKVVLILTAGVALLATAAFYFSSGYLQLYMVGLPALALGYVALTGRSEPQLPAQLFLVAELLVAALWSSASIVLALVVLPAIPLGLWNLRRGGGSVRIDWYVHVAALVSAAWLVWQALRLMPFVQVHAAARNGERLSQAFWNGAAAPVESAVTRAQFQMPPRRRARLGPRHFTSRAERRSASENGCAECVSIEPCGPGQDGDARCCWPVAAPTHPRAMEARPAPTTPGHRCSRTAAERVSTSLDRTDQEALSSPAAGASTVPIRLAPPAGTPPFPAPCTPPPARSLSTT